MMAARRQLVRPPALATPARDNRRAQRLVETLSREREALRRWMSRLRRAFRAVEKSQRKLARLETQLTLAREAS